MNCPVCGLDPCACSQNQGYNLSDQEISQLIGDVNHLRQMNEELQIKNMMFEEMAIKYKMELENTKVQVRNYEQKVIETTGTIMNLVNEKQTLENEITLLKAKPELQEENVEDSEVVE